MQQGHGPGMEAQFIFGKSSTFRKLWHTCFSIKVMSYSRAVSNALADGRATAPIDNALADGRATAPIDNACDFFFACVICVICG